MVARQTQSVCIGASPRADKSPCTTQSIITDRAGACNSTSSVRCIVSFTTLLAHVAPSTGRRACAERNEMET